MSGPPQTASLKFDPFLTRVGEPTTGDLRSKTNGSHLGEANPLMGDGVGRRGGEAKLMVLPTACCMMTQTLVSVLALAVSFNETGHRDGYEEGHLDSDNEESGCEAVFYWLMVQAFVDLGISCLTCMFLISTMKAEPVGVHGCCATVRLCVLAAGFHILYFAGLKRDLCDSFLITWATIIVWLGIGIMVALGVVLTCMLLGAVGSGSPPQFRQPSRDKTAKKSPPPPYETMPKR
mmetsp:Transcript_117475/g.184754  ORF Transcript_117475/g.184754 Transcript_117475/m.184754 type:complete len:234 (-) Transcript_117475:96-797(-)